MSDIQSQFPTLHERTLQGVRHALGQGLNHVSGLERTIVSRGAQMIMPRIEARIRRATDEELRGTLTRIRSMIDDVLGESQGDTHAQKKKRSSNVATSSAGGPPAKKSITRSGRTRKKKRS